MCLHECDRFLVVQLRQNLSPSSFAVTAPSGIAAFNIGGLTIHSFAGIGYGKEKARDLLDMVIRNKTVRAAPSGVPRPDLTSQYVVTARCENDGAQQKPSSLTRYQCFLESCWKRWDFLRDVTPCQGLSHDDVMRCDVTVGLHCA